MERSGEEERRREAMSVGESGGGRGREGERE